MRPFIPQRIFVLLLLCYLFFFFGNSFISLTDPDETFYSLTAKEMMATGQWLTPYIFGQPQFEKPVFTFWLLKIVFGAWGITPFAARFFPAVFASLGVAAVYLLGLLGFQEERKAFWSAVVLATAAFFVAMGKTLFTDMIFAVFILYALVSFFWGFMVRRRMAIGFIGFYVFGALATLTKGPIGLLIPELVVILFLLYRRQMDLIRSPWVLGGFVLYLVLALPWYAYMFHQYGQAFVYEFFYNDHWRRWLEAEHRGNDHWFFYPVTMIAGLFPWSLFLTAAGVDLFKRLRGGAGIMDHLVLSWVLVVFIVFQSAHSKLASYILPLFPAMALMTGDFLEEHFSSLQKQRKMKWFACVTFGLLALLGIVLLAAYKAYRYYVVSQWPVYFLSGFLIALSGIGLALAFKDKIRGSLYVLSMSLWPILVTTVMIRGDLESYVSSFEASQYIPHRPSGGTTVLTGKANARGIRYYTGQDIAVINFGGNPFFSPHPVPILDSQEKIANVLSHQKVTFGVVRKSVYQYLIKGCAGHFRVTLLKKLGFDYILKIEPLGGHS